MSTVIRLNPADIKELHSILDGSTPANSPRISGTKYLKDHGTSFVDGVRQEKVSLRDAKHAVDWLIQKNSYMPLPTHAQHPEHVSVQPTVRIKSVRVECDDGEFDLDIDGLQLRLLEGLDAIPLEVLGSSAALITYIRNWHEGKI